jgi:putative sterol carrier protein
MVAVKEFSRTNGSIPVVVVAGDEASGLSNIISQYLEQLLADSAEKRADALSLRGRLGMRAREGDVAVTIVFEGDNIAIEEGLQDPDAVIGGELEFLMHMMAGRANPAWEMISRKVTIGASVRRPMFAYQAYRLMRLPGVHVWNGVPRPPTGLLASAAVLLVVAVAIRYARWRAVGGDDV